VKKTEVAFNPEQYGDYWKNIGGNWGKEKYKTESVSDHDHKSDLNEEYEKFEFKGRIC